MVIDSLGMGGAEQVAVTLGKEFISLGHTVDLIIIDDIIEVEVPNTFKIHKLHFKKTFFDYLRYSKRLYSMVDQIAEKYAGGLDLVLVNLQKSTRLMKNYEHKNLYHIVHNTISHTSLKNREGIRLYFKKRSLQRIYNNLKLITVSQGVAKDLIDVVGVFPATIQTIYNPVNIEELIKKADQPLSVDVDEYVVHVGRFDVQKRHDVLLKAFVKSDISMDLVLVGDGSLKEEVEKSIDNVSLTGRVLLTGILKNPYPLIKNAKALILSSDYEGLSMVIIEALILGTPVVSTDCPSGPSEILAGELSQYLVPINDEEALAKKIKEVSRDGYKIPKNIVERFDSKNLVQEYLSLIQA